METDRGRVCETKKGMTKNVLIYVKTVDHLQSIYRYCFEKALRSQDKNVLSPNPSVGITFV